MNAIISFCHFCEHHGPSVVFCTQPYKEKTSFREIHSLKSSVVGDEESSRKIKDKNWKYGIISEDNVVKSLAVSGIETCSACRAFQHNKPGFISNDDEAQTSYVSSQYPLNADLLNLMRQAGTRSLSCEVCSGKEGVIYFGDESRGHVLSYTFFLRDSQARGFQRWFSILVLMKDKMFLMDSWQFLVQHIQRIIASLQAESNKVYELEGGNSGKLVSAKVLTTNGLKRQRVVGSPRSLIELVGNKDVWQQLHNSFTWMLKASGLRITERLVEGPPLRNSCNVGEDCISIRDLHKVFGEFHFRQVLHHLFIGDLVVIKGSDKNLVNILIDSLKVFLPKWSFRSSCFAEDESEYEKCNVIGILPDAKMSFITSKPHSNNCFIELKSEEFDLDYNEWKCYKKEDLHINKLLKCKIEVSESKYLCPRAPQVVNKICNAIASQSLSDSTLLLFLTSIIEEWINKVKVWVFTSINKKSENDVMPPADLFTASSQGPATASQNSYNQLLMAFNICEWDLPLLQFWALNFPS